MVTVFVVQDDERVRRTMCDLLDSDPDLSVLGVAGSVADAVERIPSAAPDVAVVPVQLADGSGVELCRTLLTSTPELRCLIVAALFSEETMLDAMLAGASGFLVTDLNGPNLADVIKDIAAGMTPLDNRGMKRLLSKLDGRAMRATRPRRRVGGGGEIKDEIK